MIPVSVVWFRGDEESFEKHLPLQWGGQRIIGFEEENGLHLVFLEGLLLLSPSCRDRLENVGYILHDASTLWELLIRKYDVLDRFGEYEKRCFLRWLILKDLFAGEPLLHFDADIVFNIPPLKLAWYCRDLTFVLQGCPACASLQGNDWFSAYEKELLAFTANIEDYSRTAWEQRAGWDISAHTKWSGSRFRRIIGSDQDLISHLIHTDRLPQASPESITSHIPFFLLNDPLYFFGIVPEILPLKYQRIHGMDCFNDQPVAFWHMQSDFVRYLSFCNARRLVGLCGRNKNLLESRSLETLLWRIWQRVMHGTLDRRSVYQHYFEDSDFSAVFSASGYWKEGVFV